MNRTTRAIAIFIAKLVFSASLLVFLFSRLDAGTVAEMLRTASVPVLVLGACWMFALTALSTAKWRLLLVEQGVSVPYLSLVRIYLVCQFINLFMPSILGGDAYRAAKLRHHTHGIKHALPSIVVERGTGLAALALIGSIGLSFLLFRELVWLVGVLLAGTVLLGYLILVGPVLRRLRAAGSGGLHGGVGLIVLVLEAIQPSRRFSAVVLLSFMFHLGVVLLCTIYSYATHITVSFPQLLIAVPVVYLVEIIPVSISGIGVREGTLTVLFGLMGLVPEHGLILGLVITMMRYICMTLVGGPLLLWEMFSGGIQPDRAESRRDAA